MMILRVLLRKIKELSSCTLSSWISSSGERELTQLQSILQKQVERHGRHIFKEGSMLIPGDLAYDMQYDFIKVQSTFNAQNVESYRADFVNKIITGSESVLKRKF